MPKHAPGSILPGTKIGLASLVVEEGWGELWRGKGEDGADVFLVLYCTEGGAKLFAEARKTLEQWKKVAGPMCPGLERILKINEGAPFPYLVVENSGGKTLREWADGSQSPTQLSRAMADVCKSLLSAKTYEIPFAGISPDSVVESDRAPWALIPVACGAPLGVCLFADGRYVPPEVTSNVPLDEINADTYGAAWMMIELVARDFGLARDPGLLAAKVPYARLRTLLKNGLTSMHGKYGDPKLTHIGFDRWTKADSEEDLKDVAEAAAASTRAPWQQKLHENRAALKIGGIAAGVVFALMFLVWFVPRLFVAEASTKTPIGMTQLFFQSLVERNSGKAQGYTSGEATAQVDRLLADIGRMEAASLASKFASAVPRVAGDGSARTVKAKLYGEAKDEFMDVEMTIRETAGEWKVETLFFKPLREPEEQKQ